MAIANTGEPTSSRLRAAILDEGLIVMDALWRGEPATFHGELVKVTDFQVLPRPLQQPRIPIWIGGQYPRRAAVRRAARWDGACLFIPTEYSSTRSGRRHVVDGVVAPRRIGRSGKGDHPRAIDEVARCWPRVHPNWPECERFSRRKDSPMFDHETLYAVGLARSEDMLQEAARRRRANELPSVSTPGLRSHLSRWLHALADRLEPAVEPRIAPAELHAR